jgi:hypothetical protein
VSPLWNRLRSWRAQRPPHLCPAIDAGAEHRPFDGATFDAVMAITSQGLESRRS